MGKSCKPKRFTFKEIQSRFNHDTDIYTHQFNLYNANVPLIDYQMKEIDRLEKENKRLAIERDEKLGSVYESYDFQTLAEQLIAVEKENSKLKKAMVFSRQYYHLPQEIYDIFNTLIPTNALDKEISRAFLDELKEL